MPERIEGTLYRFALVNSFVKKLVSSIVSLIDDHVFVPSGARVVGRGNYDKRKTRLVRPSTQPLPACPTAILVGYSHRVSLLVIQK